jgi:hypothetical protein
MQKAPVDAVNHSACDSFVLPFLSISISLSLSLFFFFFFVFRRYRHRIPFLEAHCTISSFFFI